jgi:hypothetical protein
LLSGESADYGGGQVFAQQGQIYAVYLPDATSGGTLDLSGTSGSFEKRWYNPRTGDFEGPPEMLNGGGSLSLGAPPFSPAEDWVVLLEKTSSTPPEQGVTVTGFTLINADTDQPIMALTNGATINLATLPTDKLNIRADTDPATVGSVRFAYDGNANYRTENAAPYALAGDKSANYHPMTPSVGPHEITVTPFAGSRGSGTKDTPLTIAVTVMER